jgi:hypothetical protein
MARLEHYMATQVGGGLPALGQLRFACRHTHGGFHRNSAWTRNAHIIERYCSQYYSDYLRGMWNAGAVTYFMVLSQHFPNRTEVNHQRISLGCYFQRVSRRNLSANAISFVSSPINHVLPFLYPFRILSHFPPFICILFFSLYLFLV